jgi:hypothetical protein
VPEVSGLPLRVPPPRCRSSSRWRRLSPSPSGMSRSRRTQLRPVFPAATTWRSRAQAHGPAVGGVSPATEPLCKGEGRFRFEGCRSPRGEFKGQPQCRSRSHSKDPSNLPWGSMPRLTSRRQPLGTHTREARRHRGSSLVWPDEAGVPERGNLGLGSKRPDQDWGPLRGSRT